MASEKRERFTAKEMAIILSHYDIGSIQEIHTFPRGNTKSPKIVLISEQGKFLLKRRCPGRDDPYRVALAHHVQMYLAQKHFCAPRLIGTRHSNHSMLQLHSFIYELFQFIEGQPYDRSGPATTDAGRCLRRFHEALADYQPAYQVPQQSYHDYPQVRHDLQHLLPGLAKHDSVADTPQAELLTLSVDLLADYDAAARTVNRLASPGPAPILCHGDWHPGNLIFRDQKVAAVLDYDAVRYMPALADVAIGCLQFSLLTGGNDPSEWPEALDPARACAFLVGYQPDEPFDDAQLSTLVALMIQALIAEAVVPIAATGLFANVPGYRFLRMIQRKVLWLRHNACDTLKTPR